MTTCGKAQSGKQRYQCRGGDRTGYCYSTTNPGSQTTHTRGGKTAPKPVVFKRALKGTVRFLVTAAQNATPVHTGFIKSLENAANTMNAAEIVVIPLRYKNPTSKWTASQANEEVWAPEVKPYLLNQRKRLNKSLMVLADVKTQPTASAPLTSFEAITAGESAILGHTKLQLRTVPTPQHLLPKIITTTGACTEENYTDSKAGKLGEFHHTLGACMVEASRSKFHLRQINASKDQGDFIDLNQHYGESGVITSNDALALDMGDTHVDSIDPTVWRATLEMIDLLRPQYLIWHDLNDNYAANPHHDGNVFAAIAKIKGGRADIQAEFERAIQFVVNNTPGYATSIIVPSNHNDFLARWIKKTNPHTVPGNFKFWCETALAMEAGTGLDGGGTVCPDPFVYWGRKLTAGMSNIRFLDRDESFQLAGIELGMHGDVGSNGARGSIKNLRRIGVKSIIGHTHSPGIDEGCYQVGTSTRLKLEYTRGPSSWLNSHCVVYANGKRSLLNIINGEWRLS